MVMNGSQSGSLPDSDTLSFGISNDGCIHDLPEPQGSAGLSTVAALDLGNCIIGVSGHPGRQPDPGHLCNGLLLVFFAEHRIKCVIVSQCFGVNTSTQGSK